LLTTAVIAQWVEQITYDERIREVESLPFPLVFSATGGMGPVAVIVYRKLASMHVGWEMENESQLLLILGEMLLVLCFVEVWCNVFEGS